MGNEELHISDAWRVLAGYGPAIWCGVLTAIAVFVIEIILCKRGVIFDGGAKKLAKARSAGHILTATRTHLRYQDREPENKTANRMYIASYEYTVNGQTRRKSVVTTSVEPPRTIYLYYVTNPKRVFSEYDLGKNPLQILLYIIPILVSYLVVRALGFNGQ